MNKSGVTNILTTKSVWTLEASRGKLYGPSKPLGEIALVHLPRNSQINLCSVVEKWETQGRVSTFLNRY